MAYVISEICGWQIEILIIKEVCEMKYYETGENLKQWLAITKSGFESLKASFRRLFVSAVEELAFQSSHEQQGKQMMAPPR